MNLVEKAEKALEYLKNHEGSSKSHELQTAAGTLGRCLGALGSRSTYARHYANLLHSALPTLLSLASNDSAEVRLVGDEALNRAVVGGFAFHSHKTNIILQNLIDPSRNARWIRAALSRICLGDCWLRPGTGKIRSQAQTLFPKLSQIVQQTSEIQLIVEALETNLPRILTALAEYTTDEEISDLSRALLSHIESTEPAVRRGVATCVAHLCSHREPLLTNILGKAFDKLWPISTDSVTIMGWFCLLKAILQINDIWKFHENDLFSVQDYLELYQLCIHYIEQSTEHNTQNMVLECLCVLLSQASAEYSKALLGKRCVCLHSRTGKHSRNISSTSGISARYIPSPVSQSEQRDLELSFSGELQLGSLLQLHTPMLSVEDLSLRTPDSHGSETDLHMQPEELSKDLSEKLQEYEDAEEKESEIDMVDCPQDIGFKVNIGSSSDEDVLLKYCARLIASKYLLTGNKREIINDRSVRVSVKASALNCMSEILQLYPQAATMYLDVDADFKNHNNSGSSEGTEMHQDNVNDFILERNVCYQDSLSDSMSQDLLNRSVDSQQTSNSQQLSKKDTKSLEKSEDSVEKTSKDVPSAILDSRYAKSDLMASGLSADSNQNMSTSNFTTNSNMTGSTFYPMTSSGDVLSSSIDLDMKFDHFADSPMENMDALKEKRERPKIPLRRTNDVTKEEKKDEIEKDFVLQHMSDMFLLLEGHNDPQIRGLVRVCVGNYLKSALNLCRGDYDRWRRYAVLPKDVSEGISMENLMAILVKGVSDDIHSTVVHTLSSLTNLSLALAHSTHWPLLTDVLNALRETERNGYWLVRVTLCRLYEKLPYKRRDDIHSTVVHTLSSLTNLSLALAHSTHWPLLTDVLNALRETERNGYWLVRVTLCRLYEKLPYKRVSDDIHSTVVHTLSSLSNLSLALAHSTHWPLLTDVLNALRETERNGYWLVRVTLCRLYEKLPYKRLFTLYSGYNSKSKLIMDTLIRLLNDPDQKVRHAASQTITNIIPKLYISKRATPISVVTSTATQHSRQATFDRGTLSLSLVRDMYFMNELPEMLRSGDECELDALRSTVAELRAKIAIDCRSNCQGLLETLQAICRKWSPWKNIEAYSSQGLLSYCLDSLHYCSSTVAVRTILLDISARLYPVEIHEVMRHMTSNRDIFERDSQNNKEKWQHLENERVASLAEKFLQVTLKMLNVLVHLIEEVNPNVHLNKSGIALPGSPVRRKTQDAIPKRSSNTTEVDEKGSLRKKLPTPANSLRANFAGHFYMDPFYMKFYDTLRATYSNHKITLDPKSSIFYEFLSTVFNCLAIQLELSTEREFGAVTEEILYYLKVIMPFKPDDTVYCVTQLLKCLFGTNMINQYSDYMSIVDKKEPKTKHSFYNDVMLINRLNTIDKESRRSSVSSNASQKLSLDTKNPRMMEEKQLLIAMENFAKNKSDRKWGTNKKELERYIRLFEPVVIQALKSYTMQNDIPLQCKVLCLLNQLLTLRVNYCMLDSDQVFIGFLMKQLDWVEQHEIPNCSELVHNILLFLVQLSSSKHHTKQIIEIPKLIQLCDGLMASGAHLECIAGLEPVAVKVFSNMGGTSVLGRAQQQEAQATREVLFYMLQKTMHQHKVLELVSCVLSLSQEHPESYYRWSELACDTLLNLLSQRTIEIDCVDAIASLEKFKVLELVSCVLSLSQEHPESYYRWSELACDTLLNLLSQRTIEIDCVEAIASLEKLLDSVYKDVLLEQSRVEILMKILFKAPPDQATTPYKLKLRYLSIIMVLLRKVLVLIPESEILLTINNLKATSLSPQSIFFNVKPDIDPLNVQNVNENCANLSPDVILVRLLFKTLTYAILEVDGCREPGCSNFDLDERDVKGQNHRLLYSVCVNIVIQVKHMLHLTTGCLFPLTAKTAQTILHNEQSGLNTGLYSPDENIPLDRLNVLCLRSLELTVHWSHLLIRLNFLTHKYWQKVVGFARNLPLKDDSTDKLLLRVDTVQIACVMAYCEYFVENGLSEVVHLTWLLVNRVHILISQYKEDIVQSLVDKVQQTDSASGLFLQAIAARCQNHLKDEFALNTYKILNLCHESECGALIFFICRIIGKMEPSLSARFAKLAVDRCWQLKGMPEDKINEQLTKEDVQIALEMLQRDQVHTRYPALVMELNSLASTVFALSPLDLSQDRSINPQYINTTTVDGNWLLNQVKNRCCLTDPSPPKMSHQNELAHLLSNLTREDLTTVIFCPEFDRRILSSCFKVAGDEYIKEFLNVFSVYEAREIERDRLREERETKLKEEMTSSIDSNKLNVVNLHVFKKSDNKESKSQFFIPISDNEVKEKFGNLELSDEQSELVLPDLSQLYLVSVTGFEKSLSDIIKLFPKQSRPLSQSENFNLNIEHSIDRYTRRCHQVFQDKLFYQEFITLQTILAGYLDSLDRIISVIDDSDCELVEKLIDSLLPSTLSKSIAIFSVMSLQYLSFLIKNKKIVESPVHGDVSFRVNVPVTDHLVIENVVLIAIENVSKALSFKEIWSELNTDNNSNRTQSAISCLYAVVKYLVKDTKPLILKHHMQLQDSGPKPDMVIIGDKLVTLIEYWEQNFYVSRENVLGKCYRRPVESLIVSLSRLDIVSNIALIPPIAWSSVEVLYKKDQPLKIDLPLQALQDMDVLEAFLFRVNLIGWSSKKQFEEMWVGLLGALQGNGPHWAIRGITQLLLSTGASRRGTRHVPRRLLHVTNGMSRLRNLLVGTSYSNLFDDINLERIPLYTDDFDGYHYAQYNTEYLKLAADITDDASFRIRQERKRIKNRDVDVNSCLQILMDVTSQMLEPKAPTGLAARLALLSCITHASYSFTETGQWCWAASQLISITGPAHSQLTQYSACGRALLFSLSHCLCVLHGFEGLQELSTVHQKLVKSLSSSYAPLRQAALQGCLLQLSARSWLNSQNSQNPCQELVAHLTVAVGQYANNNCKISLYEQSLYWTVLFTLIELGHPELISTAVDFVLAQPNHYCTDLVVKGITNTIRQQILPKELKNTIIERLLDNTKDYSEKHAVQILIVHLFSADNKLLSPKLATDVSNMDPDILMSSMERLTLLYKALRQTKNVERKRILTSAMKYFLRETLPPAATLSRVVIEFIESCKQAERIRMGVVNDRKRDAICAVLNAQVVFEVFETAASQDQLPVLSGWIFEALCHLLSGKISHYLLPYCVLTLLISASSNQFIRKLYPLCFTILNDGFKKSASVDYSWGIFKDYLDVVDTMSFNDRRLLCVVAKHSGFSGSQLERLLELCDKNRCLGELMECLNS